MPCSNQACRDDRMTSWVKLEEKRSPKRNAGYTICEFVTSRCVILPTHLTYSHFLWTLTILFWERNKFRKVYYTFPNLGSLLCIISLEGYWCLLILLKEKICFRDPLAVLMGLEGFKTGSIKCLNSFSTNLFLEASKPSKFLHSTDARNHLDGFPYLWHLTL